MRLIHCAAPLLVGAASFCPIPAASAAPGDAITSAAKTFSATWGQEPVQVVSSTRAQIVLNGKWKFAPASDNAEPSDWGTIWVPGAWGGAKSYLLPGVAQKGKGAAWQVPEGPKDALFKNLARGWYERPISIPPEWSGRAIKLQFNRVSTDAQVWVNGQDCGRVAWPYGSVDISKAVTPGQEAIVRVLVVASNDKNIEQRFMGTAENQVYTAATELETRGITGDVMLISEPRAARVSDVFVQPSVRKNQLAVDVELTDVAQAGAVTLTARCLDEKGRVEKTFSRVVNVKAGTQTVQVLWPWADARRWDFERPNLYKMMLRAEGAGLRDEYAQEFGFREFWVEGKKFVLNGSEMRLRPIALGNESNSEFLTREEIDGAIEGFRYSGFNIQEFWPSDRLKRGTIYDDRLFYERANAKGWPVIGALPGMASAAATWSEPGVRDNWINKAQAELRRYRNSPSILMWVHSPNRFGNWQDQNPRLVGNFPRLASVQDSSNKIRPAALDANAIIKSLDPTRPVSTHQGGVAGDWQMTNNYLNFIPWQEQEEWLSDWAQNGTDPYMPVEFGFILGCDLRRGRNTGGWGRWGATATEDLGTEFLAMFYGRDAYIRETKAHKEYHATRFVKSLEDAPAHLKGVYPANKGQVYREREIIDPLARQMEAEVTERTTRAWRTMGSTGGAISWEYAFARGNSKERTHVGPFVPGRRGVYREYLPKGKTFYAQPEGVLKNPILSQAIRRSDSATLAFIVGPDIAGDIAAFTAKDHSFKSGARVSKRIALLNDTRDPQAFSATWSISMGGKPLTSGTKSGQLNVAQTLFVPFDFVLPNVAKKTEGLIEMTVTIGGRKHVDTFAFRVFSPLAPARQVVSVFDPIGKTTEMLRALGYAPSTWDGRATSNLLVIGREVLGGNAKLPGDLRSFIASGGRVLVMQQKPEYLRQLGFRVGAQVRREIYPVDATHPVMRGLDATDLRDWTGSSTLVAAKREVTDKERSSMGYPVHGWKWGNRGGVSSAIVEKPHRSGWRPILEGDFDLAYSPLMELDYANGKVTLCTLDLEDHAALDPAAALLGANILRYARTAPLSPRAERVLYLGGNKGAARLVALGLKFERVLKVPAQIRASDLIVFAEGDSPGQEDTPGLTRFVAGGGQALALPVGGPSDFFREVKDFTGSLSVPNWDVCRGMSPSDLRWRAPHPARLVKDGASFEVGAFKATAEVGADGLLARAKIGKGQIIVSQLDPDRFDADTLQYFRFTRWRQTRALTQVLANMGATFEADGEFFVEQKPVTRLALAGQWKAAQTDKIPLTKAAVPDRGFTSQARAMIAPGFNDSTLASVAVPGAWEKLGGEWASSDGEAVLRRVVDVPAAWVGQDLILSLGTIDDLDNTFWNGEEVGRTEATTTNPYSISRRYTVPGRLVKAGRAVIAVRVFDAFADGGFTSNASELSLSLASSIGQARGFYHPDYRSDFALGDDPHRYYRW